MTLLGARTSHIINASVKNALKPEWFNDRKMLLTMVGLYSDKMNIKSENKVELENNPYEQLTRDELIAIAYGKPILKIGGADDLED